MLSRRVVLASLAASTLVALPAVAQGGGLPLAGVTHLGKTVTEADLPGWKLVYFGYTRCPDVCPLGLQTMAEAVDALGALGERITPIFVTVDPERDTPEALKEYVGFFHARMVGLTPGVEKLPEIAKAWRIKYARVEQGEGRAYTMDHTASVFLADPGGAIVGRFPHDLGGQGMANKIRTVFLNRR